MEQPTGTPTTPAGVVAAADGLVDRPGRDAVGGQDVGGAGRHGRADRDAARPARRGSRPRCWPRSHARAGRRRSELAWGSTADWFTHLAGTTPRRRATAPSSRPPILVAERTATHAALLGRPGLPGAGRGDRGPPSRSSPSTPGCAAHAEAVLLDEATRLNATDLAQAAKRLVELADPDKAERDAEKDARPGGPGRAPRPVPVDQRGRRRRRPAPGRGTVEDAAAAQGRPAPADQAAARAVDVERPRLRRSRGPARPRRPDVGRPRRGLPSTPWPPTCPRTATAPDPGSPSPRQPRRAPAADRLGHPRQRASSTTDDGLELAPAVVRRLACDADIIPVALGAQRRGPRRRPHCTAWSPRRSGGPSSAATSTAPSPAAPDPRSCATPTTSSTGPTAARPSSTTSSCSAASTTASSTTPPGRSGSTPTTADPSSSPAQDPATHHPTGSAARPRRE